MAKKYGGTSRAVAEQFQSRRRSKSFFPLPESLKWGIIGGAVALGLYVCQPSDNLRKHLADEPQDGAVIDQFLEKYASMIVSESQQYGLPPELVAARIETENLADLKLLDLQDRLKASVNGNASVGVMQVRASTARELDRKEGRPLRGELSDYVQLLQDPETNIQYGIRIFADLKKSTPLLSRMSAEDLLSSPAELGFLDTLYQTGENGEVVKENRGRSVVGCDAHMTLANIVYGQPSAVEVTGTRDSRELAKQTIARYLIERGIPLVGRVCEKDGMTIDTDYLKGAVRSVDKL